MSPRKKAKSDKRREDRRQIDRRAQRRRVVKKASAVAQRRKKDRRRANRRGGIRRQGETYLAKIKEFKSAGKITEPLPPLEEDEPVTLLETVVDSEIPEPEETTAPTDPDPEEENS